MNDNNEHKWRIVWIIAAVLLLFVVAFFLIKSCGKDRALSPTATPMAYIPGEYPEGVDFAEVITEEDLIEARNNITYDPANDPAYPVLDVKVELSISNLGIRPGEPRPQDIAHEYPSPTPLPTTTIAPLPDFSLVPVPSILPYPIQTLPPEGLQLYILEPNVPSPQYVGEKYKLEWKYTGSIETAYSVSLSTDGGKSFSELASGIEGEEYEVTFPDSPTERCVLRVTMLQGRHLSADTAEFTLVKRPTVTPTPTPKPAPTPIVDYIDPQVQYVDMPGLHISSESGLPVWFNVENNAENTDKLIWQLSRIPFWGTKESFGTESGVLATGELDIAGGEFSIDLKALCDEFSKPDAERDAGVPFLPEKGLYEFYVRAVALDKQGNCIGDPGRGVHFTYGKPDYVVGQNKVALESDILVYLSMPELQSSEPKFKRIYPDIFNTDPEKGSERVLFTGNGNEKAAEIIQKAVKVELQVTTSPFGQGMSNRIEPKGLVYKEVDTAPDIFSWPDEGICYMTPWGHGIEFEKFVPPKEELETMGGIYYYVRGVFYVPMDSNPSILLPYVSETLTVAYRATSRFENEVKTVTVRSDIPYVSFSYYMPPQWGHPNADEYFEVTRHIEAEEMIFSIRNVVTGDFLLPYPIHIMKYGWTREQYQAKLDEMLPKYASFHYEKSEPGFWDEFLGLLKAIYDGVVNAINDAKNAIVSLVDHIPLIGDEARAFLKKVARIAIDYGLVSIGLPPNLPNIDLLAKDGMDYIIRAGVDEVLRASGVPLDSETAKEMIGEVSNKLSDELLAEMERALLAQQQNPLRVNFLRVSRAMLYEPAQAVFCVHNYSKTRISRAGRVGFSCGNSYDVYETKYVDIPALRPGESMAIYINLTPIRNNMERFNELFYGHSGKPYMMRVAAEFDLPDVLEEAIRQGVERAPLPYVTEFEYDHTGYEYVSEFVPSEYFNPDDADPDREEFMD